MKQYSIFSLLFTFTALMGMDPVASKGGDCTSQTTVHFDKIEKRIVERIQQVPEGGFVGIQGPFFSSKPIEKALREAQARGVRTERHSTSRDAVGRADARQKKATKSGKELAKKVTKSSIHPADVTISNLHAKRVLIADVDPEKKESTKNTHTKKKSRTVFEGSDNMSVFSNFHQEVMAETSNDPTYFDQNYEIFKKDASNKTPPTNKQTIKVTPNEKMVLSSRDSDLLASKNERIKNLFGKSSEGSIADIVSMGFDDSPLVRAVEQGYSQLESPYKPNIRFILDRSAHTHDDQLRRLKEAGQDHVDIFTYNPDGSKKIFNKVPELQHRKLITRSMDGKPLTIISTGNMVPQSDRDLNTDSYHRDSLLHQRITAENNALAERSKKFELPKSNKRSIADVD